MKRLLSGFLVALTMACTLVCATPSAMAQDHSIEYQIEKVCIGYVYQCKYVEKQVGLFGCRTRCVPCWVKVPAYRYVTTPIVVNKPGPAPDWNHNQPGPNEIGGVDIRGESGAEVTTSREEVGK